MLVTMTAKPNAVDLVERISAQFGLTPMEGQVALELADGLTPREISDARETSIHTVRNQIKAIMDKLVVNRQTDIVRIVERARYSG